MLQRRKKYICESRRYVGKGEDGTFNSTKREEQTARQPLASATNKNKAGTRKRLIFMTLIRKRKRKFQHRNWFRECTLLRDGLETKKVSKIAGRTPLSVLGIVTSTYICLTYAGVDQSFLHLLSRMLKEKV